MLQITIQTLYYEDLGAEWDNRLYSNTEGNYLLVETDIGNISPIHKSSCESHQCAAAEPSVSFRTAFWCNMAPHIFNSAHYQTRDGAHQQHLGSPPTPRHPTFAPG